MKKQLKSTKADSVIDECIELSKCFHVIAGAGSGKTASLIRALESIRNLKGGFLRKNGQKIVCLTFTNRAVEVIQRRLHWDDLFVVSTLHSFWWKEISRFSKDIQKSLFEEVLPARIARVREYDDGGTTKRAVDAREKAEKLEAERTSLLKGGAFKYGDSPFSNYSDRELGHDDVIAVASSLIQSREMLRRLIGQKYPYFFVDEAQDTFPEIVSALNAMCSGEGVPIVGYFGDPMQQIYDKRAGKFVGPAGSVLINKEENFRCSTEVVNLLNAFRDDLKQFAAGKNAEVKGSVKIRCVTTEKPDLPRSRYSVDQMQRAMKRLDSVVQDWGWAGEKEVKHLYLVHQAIARRIGFESLHGLFDGEYASTKAKEEYETGEYFLLKPFVDCLLPLIAAFQLGDFRGQMDVLRGYAPAFDVKGRNAKRTLEDMMKFASECITRLNEIWKTGVVGDVLRFAVSEGLVNESERLGRHINRNPRGEVYSEEEFGAERQDWLVDEIMNLQISEIEKYCQFISENTIYSTQHGVKGEEYDKVLVVFDDVGSAWTHYSFSGLLTPKTHKQAGKNPPTERQLRLSRNLAYVCFSRALVDLRIVYFTYNAETAAKELVQSGFFREDQVESAA